MSEKLPEWICHGIYIRARDGTGIAECGSVEIAMQIVALKAQNERLVKALQELVDAATAEVNEKGAGGYLLARLTDAKAVLEEGKK